MRYSIMFAALAAVVIAAPLELKDMETANTMNDMKDAKQAADTSYNTYGAYGEYVNYGSYPGGVEEAAKAMAKTNMKRKEVMDAKADVNIIEKAEITKRDMKIEDANMVDAKQAADTSYESYGKYGDYADYGKYPGGVEEEAEKLQMA